MLIIRDLASGVKRFNQLERSLDGISPKTLSERLRYLEDEGIVLRQTFAEVPPRVEYSLSERGHDLIDVIECMRCYGNQWLCDASHYRYNTRKSKTKHIKTGAYPRLFTLITLSISPVLRSLVR